MPPDSTTEPGWTPLVVDRDGVYHTPELVNALYRANGSQKYLFHET